VLLLFPFTSARAQALEAEVDAALDALAREQVGTRPPTQPIGAKGKSWMGGVRGQHATVLRLCGLAPVLDAVARHNVASGPLARVPGMDARTLAVALDAFHAQLFTLTHESFAPAGLLSARLARRAAQTAVDLFVGSYQYAPYAHRKEARGAHRRHGRSPAQWRADHSGAMRARRLSDAVFDPRNKYEFPSTLIVRTPSELATLLGAPSPAAVGPS
jgi:hypothetical protein